MRKRRIYYGNMNNEEKSENAVDTKRNAYGTKHNTNNNVAGSTLTKGDNRDAQFLVLQPSMCIILNYQFIMLAFIFLLFKVVDQSLIEMFTKQSVPLN
ncbi:hypothetical protein T07_9314 [Trichinella nelsoni]|uniref:Uncharacterized protein n=1 Tax=Trichinella nelsoni TaxID=6336 RepID=A0A0V0RYG7_9BILA|nr:hypothetical protein T07_9314 [Trichinella nelsoni]